MALLPAICALGRAHAGADEDDENAAAHGDGDDERTPADRRRKYAQIERGADLEQAELARRCIPERFSGRVVSHIRTR
jgi:hypothetical protein